MIAIAFDFENDALAYGLAVVGILFVIAAMFSLGRGRRKKAQTQTTARDHVERARQKQGVRDELEALMVDINRMARDMGAQLDAKIVRIEQATREADQRIAMLRALQEQAARHDPYASPALSSPPPIAPQPTDHHAHHTQADPLTREVYALADRGIGSADIAQQLGEHVGKVELILALRHG